MSDAARELFPYDRTYRNNDNPSGPDFRPQFVKQDMDFQSGPILQVVPDSDPAEQSEQEGGDGDPKGSTVTESAVSSKEPESSPKVSSAASGASPAGADSGGGRVSQLETSSPTS